MIQIIDDAAFEDSYERMRDNSFDDLEKEFNNFVRDYSKLKGYYHNQPDKIKRHIEVILK